MKKDIRKIAFKVESCTFCTFKKDVSLTEECNVLGIDWMKTVCKLICVLKVKELEEDITKIPNWCPLEKWGGEK